MNSIQSLVKYFILHKHSAVSPPFGFRTITASGSGSSTSSVDQVLVLENQQCRLGSGSSTSSVDQVLVLKSSVDQVLVLKSSVDQVLVLVLVVKKRFWSQYQYSVYQVLVLVVYIRFWFQYQQCRSGSGSSTSSVDKVLVLALSVYIRFLFQNQYCSADQVLVLVQVLQCRSVYISRTYIRFWFSYQQCVSGSGSRISSVYQVLVLVLVVYIRFLVLVLVVYIRFWFLYQQRTSATL